MASYQQALRLKPDYAEAHSNLGVAMQGQKRHAEASLLSAALRSIPILPRPTTTSAMPERTGKTRRSHRQLPAGAASET